MTTLPDRFAQLSPLKRALLAIDELQTKLAAAERAAREPLAIIGMGCRFPGAASPAAFWELLRDGRSAIADVPADRWDVDALYDPDPDAAGKTIMRAGGFLEEIDRFDAEFFGIAPREAATMDPQQRLLLEVAWEALEHAGVAPDRLSGSPTGVFLGIISGDYATLLSERDPSSIEAHDASGNAHSVASGRLAYLLGLHGPAISVDTACSSSLVAMHLACQSLRLRECRMAIVGGVNLVITPHSSVIFSKARMLAADGRCKTFDASADGFVRGEGCGVLVVKRLADARADGDRVLAIVRGSAVNQDGPSSGLTAPHGPAQEALMRAALANGDVDPRDVIYVEAHGTGTVLGDPIEVQALGAVFADHSPDAPLRIGSVKTNVGHLEAAAGIAGVMKVVLAMQHGEIPAHLNFAQPNLHIDWNALPVVVQTSRTPWPAGRRRIAGISSFGFSGTNAHIVVEAAPPPESEAAAPDAATWHLILISARTSTALEQRLRDLDAWLGRGPDASLADVGYTLAEGRAHHAWRIACVARTPQELRAQLAALIQGREPAGTLRGRTPSDRRLHLEAPCVHTPDDLQDACDALMAAATTYVRGGSVDWSRLHASQRSRKIALPTYPFERERHWIPAARPDHRPWRDRRPASADHGLLGLRLQSPALSAAVWESTLTQVDTPDLYDHRAGDVAIMPAVGFIEMGCAAGQALFGSASCQLADLVIREALVLPGQGARVLQTVLTSDGDETTLQIFSAPDDPTRVWTQHVSGKVHRSTEDSWPTDGDSLAAARARCKTVLPVEKFYEALRTRGLRFGPAFLGVRDLWVGQGEALGRVVRLETVLAAAARVADPPLFDACLQVIAALAMSPETDESALYLPFAIDACAIRGPLPSTLWSAVRLREGTEHSPDLRVADLRIFDDDGRLVVRLDGLRMRKTAHLARGALATRPPDAVEDLQYEVEWRPVDVEPRALDALAHLLRPLQANAREWALEPNVRQQHALLTRLDTVSIAIIADTFRALGVSLRAGDLLSPHMADALRIVPQQRRLWHRLLDILTEDGVLTRLPAHGDNSTRWRVVRALPEAGASAALAVIAADHAAPEVTIVQRSAAALARVLTGDSDPLAVLFPEGSADLVDALYRETPTAKLYQRLAREAVGRIMTERRSGERRPQRPLRVLEVGGGTASMTEAVIDALPVGAFRYTFTDISPLLVARAVQRFAHRQDVSCSVLDLERHPAEQQLGAEPFDLIVASNVVHATRDLAETLGHLRTLLDPDGALLMLEVTSPQRWVDLSFGMTDGWWRFTDTHVRASHPLLPASAWNTLLRQTGFEDVVSVPDAADDPLLALQALIVARPSAGAARRVVGIISDATGVGTSLGEQLSTHGATVRFVAAADGALAIPDGCDELIDLRAIDPVSDDSSVAQQSLVAPLLGLSQTLASAASPPRLTVITRGAQPAGPERRGAHSGTPELEQSTLWGFARSLTHEHPALRVRCIDLDPSAEPQTQDAQAIARVLFADTPETEIAWRGAEAWTPRLARCRGARQGPIPPVRLVAAEAGRFDALTMAPVERRTPDGHEVEIHVRAAALNFRDVANVLGLRQDTALIGSECAGTVCAVGANVTDFAVGDEVIALAAGACASFATTSAALAVPKPKNMSFEEAAGVPIAWLTADYALNRVGRLQPGERVLIHAAAGGVGLAAVRLARQRGAEVFATAGSERKRAWLRAQGVPHVMDSRSHAFILEVADRTGGAGVHLALNSLAGPFIPSTLSTLARGGRFLEIGKNNIWTTVEMEAARPDVAYTPIDLSSEMAAGAPWIAPRIRELLDELGNGRLATLPRRVFGFARAGEAFRCMAQARHIGKVVLRGAAAGSDQNPFRANPRGTYAVTGGCAGLGLFIAEWLAERGAQTLVLIGRSTPDPAASARIASLCEQGRTVVVHQGDVSNPDHMAQLDARLRDLPPLRGVIHAAGVLDDGVVAQQSWSRFASVFAPKIIGARHIERLVDGQPLDFFVVFSSAAALTGPPGQSNHAAANAWLDAFAHARTADGLPTSSINWGAWDAAGAAMRPGVRERVERQGGRLIDPSHGLAALERILLDPRPQTAVLSIDWAQQDATRPNTHGRLFEELAAPLPRAASAPVTIAPAKATSRPDKDPALLARLQGVPADRRTRAIGDYLQEQARRVLGLPGARMIDTHHPLTDLGLDSLMAVEFRNLLAAAAQLTLSSTLLFEHPTLDALTRFLAGQLGVADTTSMPPAPVTSPSPAAADSPVGAADLFDRVEQLSDEDIDRLLAMHVEAAEPLADD